MKYVKAYPNSSGGIKSCLKEIDNHGNIHLRQGAYFEDIIIDRPVKISAEDGVTLFGSIHILAETQTVSIDGLAVNSETPVIIDSARDISISNCRLVFSQTAVKLSGVNIRIDNCDFEQQGGSKSYSVIEIGKAFDMYISSNKHLKGESHMHSFIKTTGDALSGSLRVIDNLVEIKEGRPGNFILLSIDKQGNQKFRFDVKNNEFMSCQSSSGGFVVINSRDKRLMTTILETNPPSSICGNKVKHQSLGIVYIDVDSEPVKDKIYVNIYDNNMHSGSKAPKPLFNMINDVIMIPVSSHDTDNWCSFANIKPDTDPVHKLNNDVKKSSESPSTILFSIMFALFVVLVVISIARKY